jgi:hypothetical protein
MKLEIKFDPETRFAVPPRQIIRFWTKLLCGHRLAMRSLALTALSRSTRRRAGQ